MEPRKSKRKTRAPAGNNAFELTASVNLELQVQQDLFNDGAHARGSAEFLEAVDRCQGHFDPQMQEFKGLVVPDDSNFETQNSALDLMLLSGLNSFPSPRPNRTPDTPREDCHLQMTLREVAGYIDRIVEADSWILRYEGPAFDLQKLAANAHMAISSQTYDCHHIWRELDQLRAPVCELMPRFGENNLLTMHPRALTVLLRLLVNSVSFGQWGSQTLENVKYMFWIVANQTLRATHPIRLLCAMPKLKSTEFLFRLLELMDVRLYSRIGSKRPDGAVFVAQEQTYAARVLASLGYTQWAEFKLQSVVEDLDTHMDAFTKADAHRTLGYVKEQACNGTNGTISEEITSTLHASKTASASALNLFLEMGQGCSNEAMFTRISLAQVSRRLGELREAETYLSEAINVWQKTRNCEDQGGSKLILDLHQVLCEQRKFDEGRELRQQYQRYFEESRVYYEENGGYCSHMQGKS
jgi:hypothetical protein